MALVVETFQTQSADARNAIERLSAMDRTADGRSVLERFRNPSPPRAVAVGDPGPRCQIVDEDITMRDGRAIRVRWYIPAATEHVLIYVHGGGWVSGDISTLDNFGHQLANACNAVVAFIEYRLAPEHPYPVPMEDVVDAVTHCVLRPSVTDAVDSVSIFIVGDSAGANLLLTGFQHLPSTVRARLSGVVAIYPAVDPTMSGASHTRNATSPTLTTEDMAFFWACYLADSVAEYQTPAPLTAMHGSEPAPILVVTAGLDPLESEGSTFAEECSRLGGDVTLVRFPHCPHGFLWMAGMFPEARWLQDRIARFMNAQAMPATNDADQSVSTSQKENRQ